MQEIKNLMKVNTNLISDIVCEDCNRNYVKMDNREFCFHCEVIKPEDEKIAKEISFGLESQKLKHLTNDFLNKSLINEDLKKSTFIGYKTGTTSQLEAKQKCIKYSTDFVQGKTGSILLTGKSGVGKSHLAVSILKEAQEKGFTTLFISLPRLFTEIKGTYKNSELSELDILKGIEKVDLLVLDDLGAERDDEASAWARTKTFEIVDSRLGKSTIYTTNFSGNELYRKYGERDFSRIMMNCEAIVVEGQNERLRHFNGDTNE
jgi:DNA replication protein DnaC